MPHAAPNGGGPVSIDPLELIKTITVAGFVGAVLVGVYGYRKQRLVEGDARRADAVAHQGMARALMGDDMLAKIALALVADIRKNLSVDWLSRKPVRAKLRTRIRRLLATFDYPPEEEGEAIDLLIKQMETFANEWAPETP